MKISTLTPTSPVWIGPRSHNLTTRHHESIGIGGGTCFRRCRQDITNTIPLP
ncbi:hypothetical protein RHGRI_004810 [Rhododendron griersonianum]|uniref:Photosystem I subunit VII n=1 Tax=Rhododendron griersonianum TaxID=479676 RepID=A0AAV6LB79_9ERIC|nr:hypothetical protein RHGRI_004810 [Rhododendron griersonianum]